ncbi:MAG TPA: hypothetical protein PK743_11225 [Luteimonas sp.]|nr:hypothetical protein [Luteimonas sp.]
MSLITEQDEAAFRRRHRGPQCEANLDYAKHTANEYAERYAAGMPDWVRFGVAALHFRHCSSKDVGDKMLLRIGIDTLLLIGRACDEANSAP